MNVLQVVVDQGRAHGIKMFHELYGHLERDQPDSAAVRAEEPAADD